METTMPICLITARSHENILTTLEMDEADDLIWGTRQTEADEDEAEYQRDKIERMAAWLDYLGYYPPGLAND
jgi:hypothetical protein